MHLKKLEIFGFKSFANKTVFTFAPGISAIVGPNGCGKTNVVDAIRWALGEQKTTVLRSEHMGNVIFNGTSSRKALGMAEVSLILENDRMVLPVEYSEVVVTRRLYRDGDSNYFLNKTQCRLKDITNLFLDTGMGADSYSVIELKMVEAILSGKAEERRRLIEEAAGINKYKIRRKEAVRKLAYVQTDLVRVQDIVLEIEKQVRSLQRSSAKTKRFNKLNLELLKFQKEIISYDYINYNKDISEFKEKLNELNSDKIKINQEISDSENYLKKIESDYHTLDEEYVKAQESESLIKDEIASLNQTFAVSNEKIKSNEENVSRFQKEITLLKEKREELNEAINLTESNIEERKQELNKYSIDLDNEKDVFNKFEKSVSEVRYKLNKKNEEIINKRNRIESIQTSHTKSEGRKLFLSSKIKESNNEIKSLNSEIDSLKVEIKDNNTQTEYLKDEIEKKNKQLIEYSQKRNEINGLIDEKKKELTDIRVAIASKNSEYEFLSNIELSDNAVNTLMKSKKWQTEQPKQMLIELVNIDEEYKPAIESSLGQYANVFIVEKEKEAMEAIALLEASKSGKAGFISREKIPNINANKIQFNMSGVIGLISEVADVDDDIRNILRVLLNNFVLVQDLNIAREFLAKYPSYRAITQKGEILDANGFIRGGSVSKKEGIFVGKSKRLKEIETALKKLNKQMADAEKNLESLYKELTDYALERLQNEIKSYENDLFYSEKTASQLKYKIETIENKIDNIKENIFNFEKEIQDIGEEKTLSVSELEQLRTEMENNKQEMIEINKELRVAESEYSEKSAFVKNIELQLTKIQTQLANEEREKVRILNELKSNDWKTKSLMNEIDTAKNEIENLTLDKGNLDSEIAKLLSAAEAAQLKREELHQRKQELEGQINQHEENLARLRKRYESLVEESHKVDLKLSELNMKLESVIEQNNALEDEKLDLANATIPEEFNAEEITNAIQELRNKLSALGNINFMALEEYETEKERLDFYHKQVKDLTDSEKTLQDTINEINETAENLFLSTFEQIKIHFKRLFKSLFSEEAEADILLSGENILECDVELVAKPPGKKPHSIDMLSGGEKTLTSIAFLFAIYLVKPSPFCILDEVDAPLDDANIDKFINMIKEFSKNIQFLIVTHNKRTMEAADTMYGITQQDEGISKIVSVKMDN